MKKVLYVTTVSRTINAFLVPHIEMLLKEGYEVQCACSIDKPVNKGLLEKGVKIYDIPFSRNPLGLGNIKAFKELVNIQKRENFDIVHVHTPIASIYGRLLKLRFKHLKTIYTAHVSISVPVPKAAGRITHIRFPFSVVWCGNRHPTISIPVNIHNIR